MKNIESWKAWVFIGSLSVIAFVIHISRLAAPKASEEPALTNYGQPSPINARSRSDPPTVMTQYQTATAPAVVSNPERGRDPIQQRAEQLAAERARFLERYLITGFTRSPGLKTVALAFVAESGKPNRAVRDALARRFQTPGVEITTTFFKPEFGADGLLADLLSGSTKALNQLELARSLDALLLARQTIQYSTNASLENVITATLQLEVMTLATASSDTGQTWKLTATGAGFNPGEARTMAEERLLKQIEQHTKMSLADTFPPNRP